ncbi:MAG: S8 family serine peptidase [bacterium]
MKRVLKLVLLSFVLEFLALLSLAAQQRTWITFRDHGRTTVSSTLADAARLGISERALWRRGKVLPADKLIDEYDRPVNEAYLDQIRSTGATIVATSRWLNAVSVLATPEQHRSIQSLSCVESVNPVPVYSRRSIESETAPIDRSLGKQSRVGAIDYGSSFSQLNAMNVIDLHSKGINGEGVIIGMCDDGYNFHKTHPAMDSIRVIAEYDFIQRDNNTSVAPGERSTQGGHGASTLSLIGGYDNGKLIGVAYGASFLLAKTEIDSIEVKMEEDLYVEGLEWLERQGADIISTSLGYIDWYSYANLDGKTAVTTKAARILARKGILLVTAMGNEGNYRDLKTGATGTMIAPADADSIVSVGAVSTSGFLASFSSTGPTYDSRIKPEIVAPGIALTAASGPTGYTTAFSGTSGATPLAAGVAALILSAHRNWTPMQVRAQMMNTAVRFNDGTSKSASYPNNFFGWGMVDAKGAVGNLYTLKIPEHFELYNSFPNPFNSSTTLIVGAPEEGPIEIIIYNALGQRVKTLFKGVVQKDFTEFTWYDGMDESGNRVASGVYIAQLIAPRSIVSQKLVYIK